MRRSFSDPKLGAANPSNTVDQHAMRGSNKLLLLVSDKKEKLQMALGEPKRSKSTLLIKRHTSMKKVFDQKELEQMKAIEKSVGSISNSSSSNQYEQNNQIPMLSDHDGS